MTEPMRARTAGDTVADDCAMDVLGELDEVLWLAEEFTAGGENSFRHARRKAEHVREFRRVLHRLHMVLAAWEREPDVTGRAGP
jgi:hypothetical protein